MGLDLFSELREENFLYFCKVGVIYLIREQKAIRHRDPLLKKLDMYSVHLLHAFAFACMNILSIKIKNQVIPS